MAEGLGWMPASVVNDPPPWIGAFFTEPMVVSFCMFWFSTQ
jgi:hypothetical protein